MKKKTLWGVFCVVGVVAVCVIAAMVSARYVFLSPSCFRDNDTFSETENYFIKKIVLEAIEDRCSLVSASDGAAYDTAHKDDIVQLHSPAESKFLFIPINADFMDSFSRVGDNEYVGQVQTNGIEVFDDCTYEFHIVNDSDGYRITFWGLDP